MLLNVRRSRGVSSWGLAAVLVALTALGVGQALAEPAAKALTFDRDVRPILKEYCLDCHGAGERLEGKLDLRLRRFLQLGGNSGPAMVPRDPAKSLMLRRMQSGQMPPTPKKVPHEKIEVIERWIAAGAPASRVEPTQLPQGFDISPVERAYWFFQPVRRPVPPKPAVADRARVRTPIDAFVLRRLREKGLGFAPDADRSTLIRRASLDLTGLPPTPEETDAFLKDNSAGAYEALIDRLLASPHYGERWGRHWLDVAGYADSEGNGSDDSPRPYAYKYRDYVIRSLNADKPLDRFITEQLAGDELVPRPWTNLTPPQIDSLVATGFLRTAADSAAGGADPAGTNQVVGDTLKIVSSTLLGLSVGCAQCHDHRYDPIPQTDYYRLRAIFEPALDPAHWRAPGQRLLSLYTDADRARAAEVDAEVRKLQAAFDEKQARLVAQAFEVELQKFPADQREKLRAAVQTAGDKRSPEQRLLVANNPKLLISPGVLYQYNQAAADELKGDQSRIDAKRAQRPVEDFVSVLDEAPGVLPVTHLFYRGDYRQPKQPIAPGDLTIAAPDGQRVDIPEKAATLPTSGRRLAWARHLVNGTHPLVGRVLANRVWMHHFGRGLVETPGEFGRLGTLPTHPELLDWLADELVRGAWSLKSLHRTIMLSTVYRQSSSADAARRSIDTDGGLLSRYPVHRLDAETLRDRVLLASGRLDRTMYGPPVALVEDAVGQVAARDDLPRRSVYLQARRSKPISFLVAFDAPVMSVNCDRRLTSNSAPQALMLMNSEFVLSHAGRFAERVRREAPQGAAEQVARAWQLAYGRSATPIETTVALQFLRRQADLLRGAVGAEKAEPAALTNLCQQLLSSNEFLYVD